MSLRTSATRYAKALLDVAIAESDPARVEQDLASIVQAFTTHSELHRVLTSPGTPQAARVGVIKAIAEQVQAQPPVAKLVAMLAGRGRIDLLPEVLVVYRERLLAHRNVVRAVVTSAAPLAPEKVRALEQRLVSVTGKNIQLETAVDPAIIGGVITRIGSTVYDGSIRTQLARMRQQLVENA